MKKNLPVIIGIVVFAAVLAGWVYTLPGVLGRVNAGGAIGNALSRFDAESNRFFSSIKETQATIGVGVATIDAAVNAEYKKDAAIAGLKAKIENKEKIKAALLNIPAPASPTKP